jgi:RND family efflux transporter MFP subunit
MKRRLIMILSIILFILLILFLSRSWSFFQLRKKTIDAAVPTVAVVNAKPVIEKERVTLPGNLVAWHAAPIYARTTGYLKKWRVDIGSIVHKNDILAIIETPELDASFIQASANVEKIQADYQLARVTAVRWQRLLKSNAVSKQETDEKVDHEKALKASLKASIAYRHRLQELKAFEKVRAPFSGVITDRQTDIGNLINIGSEPNQLKPLFRIAKISPLRLYVKVPQRYVLQLKPHMKVHFDVPEFPSRHFKAYLIETAHAYVEQSRTLLAQFHVNNLQHHLIPGGYAHVSFLIQVNQHIVRIPVNTLLFRTQGLQVATLDAQSRVVLKSVKIDRDLGDEVDIRSGLLPNQQVIYNPPDSIYAGQKVNVRPLHG